MAQKIVADGLHPHGSALHWGYYFTTMSLKKGRPFWQDMGLSLSASVADDLYDLTILTLDSFMGQATRLADVDHAHCMEVLGRYLGSVADLSASGLDDDASRIVRWILCTFYGGREENYEWLWRGTLVSLHWEFEQGKIPSGLIAERIGDLKNIAAEFMADIRVTEDALEDVSKEKLDDLDKRILSYYNIHSPEDFDEHTSPFYNISRTFMVVRFRHLWLELVAKGDQEIMDFLYDRFQRDAQKKGVHKSRPHLIHPPIPESW